MKSYLNFLNEGRVVNFDNQNSGNFIVLMGGPGSGKSFISKNFINIKDAKIFNVDEERERMAKKLNLDLNNPEDNEEIIQHTHNSTDPKNKTIKLLKSTLKTEHKILPNIIFDTVGTHVDLIKELLSLAEEQGYTTTLILVKCDIDIALSRNELRDRRLDDSVVKDYHKRVEKSFGTLFPLYDQVWVVNNSEDNDLSKRMNIAHKIK